MRKSLDLLFWIIFILPAVFLAAMWGRLPEQVPMHYNFKGEVDRYGSKTELLIMVGVITLVNVGVYLLMLNAHKIDPKRYAQSNKPRMQRLGKVIAIFLTGLICYIIYSSASSDGLIQSRFLYAVVGVLFCVLGNYLFNIKPNYFAGFRLPWALENEENWRLTHNLAGKIWFAGGLVIAALAFLLPLSWFMPAFFTCLGIMVIVPTVYSYSIFRKHRSSKN